MATAQQVQQLLSTTQTELKRSADLIDDAISKSQQRVFLPPSLKQSSHGSGGAQEQGGSPSAATVGSIMTFLSVAEQIAKKWDSALKKGTTVSASSAACDRFSKGLVRAFRQIKAQSPLLFQPVAEGCSHVEATLIAECQEVMKSLVQCGVASTGPLVVDAAGGDTFVQLLEELQALVPFPVEVDALTAPVGNGRSAATTTALWAAQRSVIAFVLRRVCVPPPLFLAAVLSTSQCLGAYHDALVGPLASFIRDRLRQALFDDDSSDCSSAALPDDLEDGSAMPTQLFVARVLFLLTTAGELAQPQEASQSVVSFVRREVWWSLLHLEMRSALGIGSSSTHKGVAAMFHRRIYQPLRDGLASQLGGNDSSGLRAVHCTGLYWMLMTVEEMALAETTATTAAANAAAQRRATAGMVQQSNGVISVSLLRGICEQRSALLEAYPAAKSPDGHALYKFQWHEEEAEDVGQESGDSGDAGAPVVPVTFLLYIENGVIFTKSVGKRKLPSEKPPVFEMIHSIESLFTKRV